MVHDYAKERSDDEFYSHQRKTIDPKLANWNNSIWATEFVGRFFVAENSRYATLKFTGHLSVIRLGRLRSLLDKFLNTVADYIEDNRQFPGVDEARAIAKGILDLAAPLKRRKR